ncbi:unnamed protein product [Polarella glacialis]|uniref:SSD domain-containing protein n=1 Tax=Polarella glacialis TaxID=89957 RepID=A0A813GQ64_POLGL|nr:unnamed protein product [Polarella glacialis]
MVEKTEIPALVLFAVACLLLLGQIFAVIFHRIKRHTSRNPLLQFTGPYQLWVKLLINYPCLVLLLSLAVPLGFSVTGIYASGWTVDIDLDFEGYLRPELDIQYYQDVTDEASAYEREKIGDRRRRGHLFANWDFATAKAAAAEAAEAAALNSSNNLSATNSSANNSSSSRRLQEAVQRSSQRWVLQLFYQALDPESGGPGIFTKEALAEMKSFEQRLKGLAAYPDYCRQRYTVGVCDEPYSASNIFFTVPNLTNASQSGTVSVVYDGSGALADIPTVLRGFLRDGVSWWTDKDFSAINLKSQYTRASFYGGWPLQGFLDIDDRSAKQNELTGKFMNRLFEDLLIKVDKPGDDRLPLKHMMVTWYESSFLQDLEIMYYLKHDLIWASGTIVVVSLLVLLRLQNIFIGTCCSLGVLFSFTTSYYFHYVVMGYQKLSVLDFISLFLIVGIAADDILLLFNTYSLASSILGAGATPRQKMAWAYKDAASAMLVTTVTTMGSFYSNCFSVVTVVRRFGFFMGTLTLVNYLLVLTIFPASILVNDLYIIPCIARCCCCCRARKTVDPDDPDTVGLPLSDVPPELVGRSTSKVSGGSFGANPVVEGYRVAKRAQRAAGGFARRTGSGQIKHGAYEEDNLELIERCMAKALSPAIYHCRWLLLLTSLALSGFFMYLAYAGFKMSTGDLEIFDQDVNLGRLAKLRKEVFPATSSADLNLALSYAPPATVVRAPVCPSLPNGTVCGGPTGACDYSKGKCTCIPNWVGPGCSVPEVPGAMTVVLGSPAPAPAGAWSYLHVLASPALTAVPTTLSPVQVTLLNLRNYGDQDVDWAATLNVGQKFPAWMSASPLGGQLDQRRFVNSQDASLPGWQDIAAVLQLAGKSASWSASLQLVLNSTGFRSDGSPAPPSTVPVAVAIVTPPALAGLSVVPERMLAPTSETLNMTPAFSLMNGFGQAASVNLWPSMPTVAYNVSLPYEVASVKLQFAAYSTEVIYVAGINQGASGAGVSQEIPINVFAPEQTTLTVLAVWSPLNRDVSTTYQVLVSRLPDPLTPPTTTTTTTSTSTVWVLLDSIEGSIFVAAADCTVLDTVSGRRELAKGMAAEAQVAVSSITLSVRCLPRRRLSALGSEAAADDWADSAVSVGGEGEGEGAGTGEGPAPLGTASRSQQRSLQGTESTILYYQILGGPSGGPESEAVVANIKAATTTSMGQAFQSALDEGTMQLSVDSCPDFTSNPDAESWVAEALAETTGATLSQVFVSLSCGNSTTVDVSYEIFVSGDEGGSRRLLSGASPGFLPEGPGSASLKLLSDASQLQLRPWRRLAFDVSSVAAALSGTTANSMASKIRKAMTKAGVSAGGLAVTNLPAPVVAVVTSTTVTTATSTRASPDVCGGPQAGSCEFFVPTPANDSLLLLSKSSWCLNNGSCQEGVQSLDSQWGCACPSTHFGLRCETRNCPGNCSFSGDCDQATGFCKCYKGYTGSDCGVVPPKFVPITNCIKVSLVWGVKGWERGNTSKPEYDESFDLLAPETQAWLKRACQLARANDALQVRSEVACWIEAFDFFVGATGGAFPVVEPGLASQALQAFMHRGEVATAGFLAGFIYDVSTEGEDFKGRPKFARLQLKSNLEANAATEPRQQLREAWEAFAKELNEDPARPGQAGSAPVLMVSGTWSQMEMESQVLGSTLTAFAGSMLISLLAVSLFTRNILLATYVCLNILLVVGMLSGFLLNIMQYEFGVVEAIGATIFVGMTQVDYCLHLAHGYHEAEGETAAQKMKQSLVFLGPSIMGGALTTIAGCCFLIPCKILFFRKLGVVLVSNSIFSVTFTFTFLAPLFFIAGPVKLQGTLFGCFGAFIGENIEGPVGSGRRMADADDENNPRMAEYDVGTELPASSPPLRDRGEGSDLPDAEPVEVADLGIGFGSPSEVSVIGDIGQVSCTDFLLEGDPQSPQASCQRPESPQVAKMDFGAGGGDGGRGPSNSAAQQFSSLCPAASVAEGEFVVEGLVWFSFGFADDVELGREVRLSAAATCGSLQRPRRFLWALPEAPLELEGGRRTSSRPDPSVKTLDPKSSSEPQFWALAQMELAADRCGGAVRVQKEPKVNRILYVRNLPYKISADELYDIFGKYGSIRQIRRGSGPETKGTAFVVYDDIYDAKNAMDHLSGFNVAGRYLVLLFYNPTKMQSKVDARSKREDIDKLKRKYGVE